MAWQDNAKRYINKYNSEKYDRIAIRVPQGLRDAIKDAANQAGLSMAAFITTAVEEKIKSLKKT
ncbi:YlcI/YnfO family protein [Selenomonas sputigena]|uniref:YlcI/YnfO family protein n=1 Tax=Selenomonas sputigena TaxID=69823 RepID=UPI002233EC82|nr:YlcI/YnfO family protein [Selenomonas sputigena]UZE45989.1 hypothetical protein OL236_03405 [Selenomonas sputigena]